jgi:uncharacterized HhH-GPD family protein
VASPAVQPAVASLPWTGDPEADRLLVDDPNAFLIGFCLDQQITVQHAFHGPLTIRERLGTLDVAKLAAMDTDRMRAAFAKPPAIHRYPRSMAQRVQRLCAVLASEYGGDASRVWREASDARALESRLKALPGIGPQKARTIINVLGKLLGVRPTGWEGYVPEWMTLGDAATAEQLNEYQTRKRAHKAELRAQGLIQERPRRTSKTRSEVAR